MIKAGRRPAGSLGMEIMRSDAKSLTAVLILALLMLSACAGPDGGAEADLTEFFNKLNENYTLPEMLEADDTAIDGYYPGLNDIAFFSGS
jgi:hypothetical protein